MTQAEQECHAARQHLVETVIEPNNLNPQQDEVSSCGVRQRSQYDVDEQRIILVLLELSIQNNSVYMRGVHNSL